ncbi:hypothetical protein [Streptomyces radicis]|uniref:hypothetical protein n=1 Tax=Streptomyces radicis TaxID=1750517 RepID=UPI0016004150|nr:hypothetical protein [Streptomyces radicis]
MSLHPRPTAPAEGLALAHGTGDDPAATRRDTGSVPTTLAALLDDARLDRGIAALPSGPEATSRIISS